MGGPRDVPNIPVCLWMVCPPGRSIHAKMFFIVWILDVAPIISIFILRTLPGLPTLKAATTSAGAAGAAEVAHLICPLILDILKQDAQGKKYSFTGDDYVLCMFSFFQRAWLCESPRVSKSTGDNVVMKFSWYNSVNAGWSIFCWALLTGRATVSSIGRGAFLVAMQGQSETNRLELATAGIKTSQDFNRVYSRWNRIKPHCGTLAE